MNGIIKDHALDKLDIKRIKHADYVCFDLNGATSLSQLRFGKRAEHTQTGYEEEYTCPINASIDLTVGYTNKAHEYPNVCAFDMVNCGYNLPWRTIASALREGDVLCANWYSQQPGNDKGGYIGNAVCTLPDYRDMPLWYETLSLTIIRKGDAVAEYHVSHHMTPDNSAKMVKWHGR